ncbi:MAG TPA: nuclear transport factor 2 family protein [Gemmatimonadaceae bacterium]|nr:nuclear transport factor 2 family protein [Gemmatimonadaceae bacterium]
MQRILILICGATLGACTANTASESNTAAVQWDSAGANEARAAVERGVNAFSNMDIEGLRSVLATEGFTTSYDLDLENKPLRLATRDEAIKYAETTFAEVKKLNITPKIVIKNLDCRAASGLSYCVLEHDFVATMPDGKAMTQSYQATFALTKEADGWKWMHFHTSPAAAAPAAK